MKIVKFLGGLGNQMFQYAFYLSLKQRFGRIKADLSGFEDYALHHGYELEKVFGIRVDQATPFERRLYRQESRDWLTRKLRRVWGTKHAYCPEKVEFGFDPGIYEDQKSRYYWGYWQHHRYHEKINTPLEVVFEFRPQPEGKNLNLIRQLGTTESVSIHVRRGDYLGDALLGGVCDLEYYSRAIDMIKERIISPRFVVFSDDIEWCRQCLGLSEAVFVDWNKGEKSFFDMLLMSRCNHHIIANSSFSWWGARLNPGHDKIVIAPKTWVKDPATDTSGMILPNWISI